MILKLINFKQFTENTDRYFLTIYPYVTNGYVNNIHIPIKHCLSTADNNSDLHNILHCHKRAGKVSEHGMMSVTTVPRPALSATAPLAYVCVCVYNAESVMSAVPCLWSSKGLQAERHSVSRLYPVYNPFMFVCFPQKNPPVPGVVTHVGKHHP